MRVVPEAEWSKSKSVENQKHDEAYVFGKTHLA